MIKKIWGRVVEHKEPFMLLGLLVIFYAVPGNLGRQVFGIDYMLGGYPVEKAMAGREARWLPYIFCGVPAWLPPNPIYFGISFYSPVELAQSRYYFVLFLLAGWGMFAWAKRWFAREVALLGAVGWMLAPIMVSLIYAGHGGKIAIMAHFPWILWAIDGMVDKKSFGSFIALVIVTLSAIFSWHTQMLAYAAFFSLIYGLWRAWGKWRVVALMSLAVLLGAIPSIPHYISFRHIVSNSSRASGVGVTHRYNLPPSEIVGMINPVPENPDKYDGPRGAKLHSEYIGIFVFLLGIAGLIWGGRIRWIFLLIGLISLIFALGIFNWKMIRSPSMALFGLSFAWVTWAMAGAEKLLKRAGIWIAIVFIAVDLAAIDYHYIRPVKDIPQYPQVSTEYRAYDALGWGNMAVKDGSQIVNGNYPLIPKTFVEFVGGKGILPDFSNFDKHENYRKLANVKNIYMVQDNRMVVGIMDALPKAFVVGKYRVIPGNCVDSIPMIDPAKEVILAEDPQLKGMGSRFTATIEEYELNSVVVNVDGDGPGILVLCDNYFPGWKCWVDGMEAKIIRANHTFRGVPVRGGKHTVLYKI